MTRSICDASAPCDGHRDGCQPEDKCPGLCDAEGCRAPANVGSLCRLHAIWRVHEAMQGAPHDEQPYRHARAALDEVLAILAS